MTRRPCGDAHGLAPRSLPHARVTSNHVSPQLRAGCAALGADGYFDKVKELTALAGALARIARAKRGGPS